MKRVSIAIAALAVLTFSGARTEAASFAVELTAPADGGVMVVYPSATRPVPAPHLGYVPYHGDHHRHVEHRAAHPKGHSRHRQDISEAPAQPDIQINVLTDIEFCRSGLFGRIVNNPCRLRNGFR